MIKKFLRTLPVIIFAALFAVRLFLTFAAPQAFPVDKVDEFYNATPAQTRYAEIVQDFSSMEYGEDVPKGSFNGATLRTQEQFDQDSANYLRSVKATLNVAAPFEIVDQEQLKDELNSTILKEFNKHIVIVDDDLKKTVSGEVDAIVAAYKQDVTEPELAGYLMQTQILERDVREYLVWVDYAGDAVLIIIFLQLWWSILPLIRRSYQNVSV
jgi:hypothetical protein